MLEFDHPQLEPGGMEIRLEPDRLLADLGRLRQAIQRTECGGKIVERARILGPDLQRLARHLLRLGIVAPVEPDRAQVAPGARVVRVEPRGLLVAVERLVRHGHLVVDQPAIVPALHVPGRQVAHLQVGGQRVGQPVVLEGRQTELSVAGLRLIHRRPRLDQLGQRGKRIGELGVPDQPAQLLEGARKIVYRPGGGGGQPGRLPLHLLAPLQLAGRGVELQARLHPVQPRGGLEDDLAHLRLGHQPLLQGGVGGFPPWPHAPRPASPPSPTARGRGRPGAICLASSRCFSATPGMRNSPR